MALMANVIKTLVTILTLAMVAFSSLAIPFSLPPQPDGVMAADPVVTNCSTQTDVPQEECQALLDLNQSTNGPKGWGEDNSICSWRGITCQSGSVTSISLGKNQLSGSIPDTLGNLSNLQYLYLHSNELSGSIPDTLGNLSNLQMLFLYSNELSGSIPTSLANLTIVQNVRIDSNQLDTNVTDQVLLDWLNEKVPNWKDQRFPTTPTLTPTPTPTGTPEPIPFLSLCRSDLEIGKPCYFDLEVATLVIEDGRFASDGSLYITTAFLELFPEMGGTEAAFTVEGARIGTNGVLEVEGGEATLKFPNIRVGGKKGFGIEGAEATLLIEDGEYRFKGVGTFVLPGVGPGKDSCEVGTGFELAKAPPPLREIQLSLKGCVSIPIGNTSFFMTGVRGKVQLQPTDIITVSIGVDLEGLPIPGTDEAAINGEADALWDNTWAIGLTGDFDIFSFDAAEAELMLSEKRGLEGTVHIEVVGIVEGDGNIRIYKDTSKFHVTGKTSVQVLIAEGSIYQGCRERVCVTIPDKDIKGPKAQAYFGEFITPKGNTTFGIKGTLDVLGYQPAFFVDAIATTVTILDELEEYQPINGLLQQDGMDIRKFAIQKDIETLLFALAFDGAETSFTLTSPSGQLFTTNSDKNEIIWTNPTSQTIATIPNPEIGLWTVTIDNPQGSHYHIAALGAPQPAMVEIPNIETTGEENSYTITIDAQSTHAESTVSLFYDELDNAHSGVSLVEKLPIDTTSYTWEPTTVPSGTYYIYAMVDSPLDAPAFDYYKEPITINDTTPPEIPTGVQVQSTTEDGSSVTVTWDEVSAVDLAGYYIYYYEPDNGITQVQDIPVSDNTRVLLQGLYLTGDWSITVSAYDLSGNESEQSEPIMTQVDMGDTLEVTTNKVYLPIIIRVRSNR
jgi:hypothetical protein